MASSDAHVASWTCFLKLWKGFENWNASQESMAKKIKLERSNFGESSKGSSSKVPNILPDHLIIIGVIYPSPELFGPQGLKMKMLVPSSYPFEPPTVYICTMIPHPNIDKDGKLCSSKMLHDSEYKPVMWNGFVEIVINLLEKPESGSAVDTNMSKLYESNPTEYNRKIKDAVEKYEDRPVQ